MTSLDLPFDNTKKRPHPLKQCSCRCATDTDLPATQANGSDEIPVSVCGRNFQCSVTKGQRDSGLIPDFGTTGWYDTVNMNFCVDMTLCTNYGTNRLKNNYALTKPASLTYEKYTNDFVRSGCLMDVTWVNSQGDTGTLTGIRPSSTSDEKQFEHRLCYGISIIQPLITGQGDPSFTDNEICYSVIPTINCNSGNIPSGGHGSFFTNVTTPFVGCVDFPTGMMSDYRRIGKSADCWNGSPKICLDFFDKTTDTGVVNSSNVLKVREQSVQLRAGYPNATGTAQAPE